MQLHAHAALARTLGLEVQKALDGGTLDGGTLDGGTLDGGTLDAVKDAKSDPGCLW